MYPIVPPVSKLSGHPAWHNRVKLNRDIHFTCILRLLNNTCVKHYSKSVHVSNLFWSREYNSTKKICKYPSFSKVLGNYPLDLKIIWSSVFVFFFAFEKVSMHVPISCPTINKNNLTHCYQFIPILYSSIVLVLLICERQQALYGIKCVCIWRIVNTFRVTH